MAELGHWRRIARPIIAEVINRVGREDDYQLRKALFEAYPFGERKYHPYRTWLDEIKRQLGDPQRKRRRCDPPAVAPGQTTLELFPEGI